MGYCKFVIRVPESDVGAFIKFIDDHGLEEIGGRKWDNDPRLLREIEPDPIPTRAWGDAPSDANSAPPRPRPRARSRDCHDQILAIMRGDPARTWTRQMILRSTGMPIGNLDRNLGILVREGVIVRAGSDRSGMYRLAVAARRPVVAGSHHDFLLHYLQRVHPRRVGTAEIAVHLIEVSGSQNPATSARLGELRDQRGFVDFRDGTWGLTQAGLAYQPEAAPAVEIEIEATTTNGDGAMRAESRE
jgi:hypothetical protein